MMPPGAEAIAAKAQPPGKDGNIVFPEKLSNPVCLRLIYLLQAFWEPFLLTMFIKENIFK